jgi:amino acid adenylation domain-containing protein
LESIDIARAANVALPATAKLSHRWDLDEMSDTIDSHRSLWDGFLRSCKQFPTRGAIDVAGREVTYQQLAYLAKRLAATLQAGAVPGAVPLTAVFAHRSETAYAAVLGVLLAGHGYVPLNRTFPIDRTRLMLERSMCRSVIVDAGSEPQLEALLCGIAIPLVIICPDRVDVTELAAKFPAHRIMGANELADAEQWRPVDVAVDSIAYLLFTSGSTGQPKGVMVSHANVLHYLDCVTKRYGLTSNDRMSQMFDLTFDLSAHDMFVAWESGACLCCPTQKQLIKPGAFVNDARLTVWFSVPSTATFMRRLGVLKPGMYPRLRLSLFCGEALPVDIVRHWALAAPNSVIENIYGPTELTIGCTAYQWDNAKSPDECEQGIVPIGQPFDGMRALIVDEQLREVEDGRDGELLVTGPQLSLGYWQDEEKTRQAFFHVAGKNGTYYRTGDRVRRSAVNGPLVYLGRLDNQIKVLGHRVELGEVEAAVRQVSGLEGVVALGWPTTESGADGIEVFLETASFDTRALVSQLKGKLPVYMLPRNVLVLRRFPLNANGKYDRKALQLILENTFGSDRSRTAIPHPAGDAA